MLRNAKELWGYVIRARDGEIGKAHDFFLDDSSWQVRYLVVDTGGWLSGRDVLLSPAVLGQPDPQTKAFPVTLTVEQVRNSPPVETELPVSRQKEAELAQYFGWPGYWTGDPLFGPSASGMPLTPVGAAVSGEQADFAPEQSGDPRLRSAREVAGYHIQASDGEIGHLDDYLIDSDTWSIRYLVVDTRNWLPGKKVLVAPDWVRQIDWASGKVAVDLDREKIRDSPEFDSSKPLDREYETRLHEYYGRKKYWA